MTLNIEAARHAMIEQQIRPWDVTEPRVLAALAAVPRERFVPELHKALAFADTALPIGHGERMLKPVLEGRLLQALQLQPDDEALVVGTGSGFLTACVATLARAVTSIDRHADFLDAAKAKLAALDLNNVRYELADAPAFRPGQQFDAILVTGAVAEVPEAFRHWLRDGGRLVLVRGLSPVQEAVRIIRDGDAFRTDSLFETDIPYLAGAEPVETFAL